MSAEGLDYGICQCESRFETCYLDVRLSVCDTIVVLSGVPQGVCNSCGTKVYKPATLDRLETLLRVGPRFAEPKAEDEEED